MATSVDEVITIYDSEDECYMDIDYTTNKTYTSRVSRPYYFPVDLFYFLCEYYQTTPSAEDTNKIIKHEQQKTKRGASQDVTSNYRPLLIQFKERSYKITKTQLNILKKQAECVADMGLSQSSRFAVRAYFMTFNTKRATVWYNEYDK